jgi:hypothetical protein
MCALCELDMWARRFELTTCNFHLVFTNTQVVTNSYYAENARKVSKIVLDTPKPPVELAADWVEYVLPACSGCGCLRWRWRFESLGSHGRR